MYDRGTDYGDMFPKGTKTTEDTLAAFREWTKPDDKILSFYADNAPELKAAAKELGWRNPTGTPGQPKTNGVIENKVRLTKGGTKCNLSQSGLHKSWWPFAGRAYWFARNTKVINGSSPYALRNNGENCKALQIPFGTLVDYMPTATPAEAKRQKQWEQRTRTGLLVGWHLQPGAVLVWRLLRRRLRAFAGRARLHPWPVPCAPDLGGVLGPG